jgi:hypothetical protein
MVIERLDRVQTRLGKVEDGLLNVNLRVDGVADDMRQRFRVLNERIGSIAASHHPRSQALSLKGTAVSR